MPGRAHGRLLICSAVVLGVGALGVSPMVSAASPRPSVPTAPGVAAAARPVVSPYLELSGAHLRALDAAVTAGLRSVTVAFVIGDGCTPVWDDGSPVASDAAKAAVVAGARARGVEVVVSFGGQGGIDLARSCPSRTRLDAAYEAVVRRLHVTHVDFDVEGAAIAPVAERASIARRFAAIRRLQSRHPHLVVTATLPAGPVGLEASGTSFLDRARRTRTRLDVVNIMTMDYGGPVRHMGAAAIAGARGTLTQLRKVWPSSTYANLGITPMIGQNDSPGEVLTVTAARYVEDFARRRGVGRLSFWSLNRDQPCVGEPSGAQGDCSGTNQSPLQFTRTFLGRS